MPEIKVAEQAGVGADGGPRPTEDHVLVLDNAVVLLDGATSPPPGGWYAGLLAERLADSLPRNPDADLAELLAESIAALASEHGLRPGNSPSSTVAMLRWTDSEIEGLVLADSPIVAFGRTGADLLADDRLTSLRRKGKLNTGAEVRALRNTEGGFWVAEADPRAAREAVRKSWPRNAIDAVLVASDGVAVGADEYRIFDWPQALELARDEGPHAVLDAVRAAEKEDPDGIRWPRVKRHDDQALVLVNF